MDCPSCNIADDLRAWRKAHGLKAYQVAEMLGYSVEHISRVENGTRNLSRAAWASLTCQVNHAPEQVVVFPSLGTSLAQGKATPTPEASS